GDSRVGEPHGRADRQHLSPWGDPLQCPRSQPLGTADRGSRECRDGGAAVSAPGSVPSITLPPYDTIPRARTRPPTQNESISPGVCRRQPTVANATAAHICMTHLCGAPHFMSY